MKKQYDVIIFTAIELTRLNSALNVLILDTGRQIDKRKCPARVTGKCVHCAPCAIVSGWSGAGAFSDGKLSLSQEVGGHITDYLGREKAAELIQYADSIYCDFGASNEVHGLNDKKVDEIRYECSRHNIELVPCPVRHLGTERAFDVLRAMYVHLIENTNTEFMELTSAKDILVKNGRVCGITVEINGVST